MSVAASYDNWKTQMANVWFKCPSCNFLRHVPEAGFKLLTIRLWVECCTIQLFGHNCKVSKKFLLTGYIFLLIDVIKTFRPNKQEPHHLKLKVLWKVISSITSDVREMQTFSCGLKKTFCSAASKNPICTAAVQVMTSAKHRWQTYDLNGLLALFCDMCQR
jgi:hypothetical protein